MMAAVKDANLLRTAYPALRYGWANCIHEDRANGVMGCAGGWVAGWLGGHGGRWVLGGHGGGWVLGGPMCVCVEFAVRASSSACLCWTNGWVCCIVHCAVLCTQRGGVAFTLSCPRCTCLPRPEGSVPSLALLLLLHPAAAGFLALISWACLSRLLSPPPCCPAARPQV